MVRINYNYCAVLLFASNLFGQNNRRWFLAKLMNSVGTNSMESGPNPRRTWKKSASKFCVEPFTQRLKMGGVKGDYSRNSNPKATKTWFSERITTVFPGKRRGWKPSGSARFWNIESLKSNPPQNCAVKVLLGLRINRRRSNHQSANRSELPTIYIILTFSARIRCGSGRKRRIRIYKSIDDSPKKRSQIENRQGISDGDHLAFAGQRRNLFIQYNQRRWNPNSLKASRRSWKGWNARILQIITEIMIRTGQIWRGRGTTASGRRKRFTIDK